MKKTLLASAIALSLGSVAAQAAPNHLTITITNMNFNGVFAAAGTMNSDGNGSMSDITVPGFFGAQWTAEQQVWFDATTGGSVWSGTGTASNTADAYAGFSYTFNLTGNQVAAGTFFDWSGNENIPVFTIYDCDAGGGNCVGSSAPMQTLPFPGQQPSFIGTTADDMPSVPVPAAVWLMGSGLLGLVGVARRRKVA